MTRQTFRDFVEQYDGRDNDEVVTLYSRVWDERFALAGADPGAVAKIADRLWLAVCIAFKFALENRRPIVDGAIEPGPGRVELAHTPFGNTRLRPLEDSDMVEEVHRYLDNTLPHFTEEWAAIRDVLDSEH